MSSGQLQTPAPWIIGIVTISHWRCDRQTSHIYHNNATAPILYCSLSSSRTRNSAQLSLAAVPTSPANCPMHCYAVLVRSSLAPLLFFTLPHHMVAKVGLGLVSAKHPAHAVSATRLLTLSVRSYQIENNASLTVTQLTCTNFVPRSHHEIIKFDNVFTII